MVGVVALAASLLGNVVKPAIEVRKITPQDSEIVEEWERVTRERDIVGVSAAKLKRPKWNWQIFVNAAEFVRTEPLEGRLEREITAALRKVGGVSAVVREDREVWLVQGDTSGGNLVRACAVALDRLGPEIRQHMEDLRKAHQRDNP